MLKPTLVRFMTYLHIFDPDFEPLLKIWTLVSYLCSFTNLRQSFCLLWWPPHGSFLHLGTCRNSIPRSRFRKSWRRSTARHSVDIWSMSDATESEGDKTGSRQVSRIVERLGFFSHTNFLPISRVVQLFRIILKQKSWTKANGKNG